MGYPLLMKHYLPGALGLMLVSLLAAFMSTITRIRIGGIIWCKIFTCALFVPMRPQHAVTVSFCHRLHGALSGPLRYLCS